MEWDRYIREQDWRSGESTRLPPMWPGIDFRILHHMWVEFVGSLLCSERFFLGYFGFPLSSKTNICRHRSVGGTVQVVDGLIQVGLCWPCFGKCISASLILMQTSHCILWQCKCCDKRIRSVSKKVNGKTLAWDQRWIYRLLLFLVW